MCAWVCSIGTPMYECLHVWAYMYVQAPMHMCTYYCGSQRLMLDGFLDFFPPYIHSGQVLSLKHQSSLITNLASQLALRILCFYLLFSGIMDRPPCPPEISAGAKRSKLQSSCLHRKCFACSILSPVISR